MHPDPEVRAGRTRTPAGRRSAVGRSAPVRGNDGRAPCVYEDAPSVSADSDRSPIARSIVVNVHPKETSATLSLLRALRRLRSDAPRGRRPRRVSPAVVAAALLPTLLLAACGGREVVPAPGLTFGTPPALDGQEVMVVPIQSVRGVSARARPDAELAFALREREARVRWLFPDTLRRLVARNPAVDIALDRLPVASFLQARVERIGDPLYGHLRRLAGLSGAPLVLIPVRLRYRSETVEVDDRVLEPAMELTAALVHIRTGRVLWFGILDGETGDRNDPRVLASAADALARAVVP